MSIEFSRHVVGLSVLQQHGDMEGSSSIHHAQGDMDLLAVVMRVDPNELPSQRLSDWL